MCCHTRSPPSTPRDLPVFRRISIGLGIAAAQFQGCLQSLRSLVRSSEDGERVTDRWLFIYVGILFIAGLVVSFLVRGVCACVCVCVCVCV